MPYKPHDSSKSPMTDFQWDDIQADVLATDVSTNSKISSLKQLKTETKIPTKAINALAEQLENAQASASDAVQRVSAVTGGIDLSQLAADVEALKAAIQANPQSEEGQSNVTSRLAAAETRMTNLENVVTNLNDAPVVYKNVKHFDDYTKNGEAMDVVDHTFIVANGDEVQASLPDAVSNVTFSNAQPEDSVNVYFDSDELAEINSTIPGDYPVNLTFEHGYGSTFYAPSVIVHVNGVNTQASHIYGMVLVGAPYTQAGWVRVNTDYETINFNAEHGTWAGIRTIDDDTYGSFVEIPTTYVRTEVLADGPYAGKTCYWIADGEAKGFHAHPAFLDANGKPGVLRIAAYPTSSALKSERKSYEFGCLTTGKTTRRGSFNENDYSIIDYNTMHAKGWNADGVRPYSIYDHQFLARMVLTEYGIGDVHGVNGPRWNGCEATNYHGINHLFGLPYSRLHLWLDGLTMSNTLCFTKPDSRIDVTTSIEKNGIYYIIDFLTGVVDNVNLGDLFIADDIGSYNAGASPTAHDSQTYNGAYAYTNWSGSLQVNGKTTYFVDNQEGIFHFVVGGNESTQKGWRMTQIVSNL